MTYISVIGTVFVDCKGFARNRYTPDGRNLGDIRFVHGGVGRNVAENIAALGIPTALVSSVDDSALGLEVLNRLQQTHVDTSFTVIAERQGMGMWLAIMDENGNLAGSISQMPDLSVLESTIKQKGSDIVRRSSHLALELDLTPRISETVLELARQYDKPIFGLPGNMDIILKYPEMMKELACFICNNFEAERLFGQTLPVDDAAALQQALEIYVEENKLSAMVVTLGAHGAVFYDFKTKQQGYQPVFPVQLVDSSGAGDAFFSATAAGLAQNLPLSTAVAYGTRAAGWTIESAENTCPNLALKFKREGYSLW